MKDENDSANSRSSSMFVAIYRLLKPTYDMRLVCRILKWSWRARFALDDKDYLELSQ